MALISFGAYARHRGVSKQAVSSAVKEGRVTTVVDPVDGKRKIDPELADKEWALKTDDRRRPLSERVENAERNDAVLGRGGTPRVIGGKKSATKTVQEYADARAEREGLQAKLTRIELGKKSGELVSAKAVEAEAFRLGRTIRDNLLNVPDRISHQLAAETDPAKVHEILRAEIHQVLEALAGPDPMGQTQDELAGEDEPEPAADPSKKFGAGEGASHANP